MGFRIDALNNVLATNIDRRQLAKVVAAAAGTASMAPLLAACSGDEDDVDEGTDDPGAVDEDEDPETEDNQESDEDDGEEATLEEVVISQKPEITTAAGHMSTGIFDFNMFQHYMEPLVHRGPDLEVEPMLATQWEQVDDYTTRFTLRDDVVFHNGDPLTAEDVVFTYELITDPEQESQLVRYARTLESATVVDDLTVDLTLTEIDGTFILRQALIPIVPKAAFEEMGAQEFGTSPIGTGPYRFVEWQQGESLALEAFDDYWGDAPMIRRLVFRPIPEDSTRVAELQTGAVDIITNVPPHLAPEIEEEDGIEVKAVNGLRSLFGFFNTHKQPFDDVRMRKAANFAVDTQLITDEVLDGFGEPTSQPYGKEVFGFNPDLEGYYDYDPDEARRLMEEAGYGDGVEINLFSPSGRYLRDTDVAQNIGAQLDEVGFTVNVNFLEFQAFGAAYVSPDETPEDADLVIFSNANNTGDADYNLSLNVHSGGGRVYWTSSEMDELIDDARQTFDEEERIQQYARISEILVAEECIWLFLHTQYNVFGVSDNLANWEPRADEMIYLGRYGSA